MLELTRKGAKGKADTERVAREMRTLIEYMKTEGADMNKAQGLAETQKRILQDEYFAHAEKAMDNLRAAKENAAALKNESAAEGRNIRFSIQCGADRESYDIVNIDRQKNRTSHDTYLKSEDNRGSLWEGSKGSIAQNGADGKENAAPVKKNIRFQLASPVEMNNEKETSGKAHMESEDSGSSGSEVSKQSIAQDATKSKRTDEPVKKSVRFQMAEQALDCQLEVFLESVGKNDIKHWSAPHPWHP